MNKILLGIRVRVDDWTAERAIISTNISHVGAVMERYKHVKQWLKNYVAMLLNKGFITKFSGHLPSLSLANDLHCLTDCSSFGARV